MNEINVQTAMSEYTDDIYKTRQLKTQYKEVIGPVSQVYDNTKGHGEQVYAVVEDLNQKPEEVKEVTVLFRGSTGVDKYKPGFLQSKEQDMMNDDVINDWIHNDLPMAKNILTPGRQGVTAQLKDASKDFNRILAKYPNAKIKVYGHSLGAMNTQYALANMPSKETKRIIGGWAFNGPNIYSELTSAQRKQMKGALKGKLQIYYDPKDAVGLGYTLLGKDLPAAGTVYQVKSKQVTMIDQHMTYGYQLDKKGQIEIENVNPKTASLNQVVSGMSTYYSLKKERSKQGLSDNEEFFLDSTQAEVIAKGLVATAETAEDEIEKVYKSAAKESEELYQSTKIAPIGITELSAAEIQEAYEEAGLTYDRIVGKTERHFTKKIDKAEKILEVYTELQGKIQSGIEDAFAKDDSLAGEFQKWSEN